jgi:pimeloyl-ACP methyl ester carboxylesterase
MTQAPRALAFSLILAGLLTGCAERAIAPPTKAPALFVDCRGPVTAAPTVILEAGAFGVAADWDLVQADLAKGGRVCAYDRAGIGRSPPRAGSKDAASIARDLAGLLDQLGERRPVILVGHSNGALYVETFAALYPQRVAGLVYVNGVTSNDLDYPLLIDDLTEERRLAGLARLGAGMGLAPLIAQVLTGETGLTGEAAQRKRDALNDPATLSTANDEDQAVIPSLAATRRLGGAPARIPTVVICGSTDPDAPLSQAWRAAEAASAGRASVKWILEAPGATHTSPLVRDRGYVVAGVNWLRSFPRSRSRAPTAPP